MLDGSSSQSSNSTSNGRTSVSSSKSGSMFDEDDDFVVPDVPDVNGSGESQGECKYELANLMLIIKKCYFFMFDFNFIYLIFI